MENKYNLNEKSLEIYQDFISAFKNFDEQGFGYNGVEYCIDYKNGKICIYEDKENGLKWLFDTPEDFFENFILDGKPIIKLLEELTDYD